MICISRHRKDLVRQLTRGVRLLPVVPTRDAAEAALRPIGPRMRMNKRSTAMLSAAGLVATAGVAYQIERSGRYSAEGGPTAALVATVRFTRALATTVAIAIDYRLLFTRHTEYKSDRYKAERSVVHSKSAHRLLELCRSQGAVYVKVGQHVASMSHAVPKEYTSVLTLLEDRAAYRPYEQVERVVCRELGGAIEDHFATFDPEPVAAASLAQVHRATLAANGETVAVKVQYPGLETLVAGDLASLRALSYVLSHAFPSFNLDWIVAEFKANLSREIDFRKEAASSEKTRRFFKHDNVVRVPRVYQELSTCKLLCMEFIDGFRADDVDKLTAAGIEPAAVATAIVRAFGMMTFISGNLHADGHGGNILCRPGAPGTGDFELFLIDHGLYRSLSEATRKAYCLLWRGLVLRRGDDVDRACKELGAPGLQEVFSIFLLNRSLKSAKQAGTDLREMMTREEIKAFRDELKASGIENSADAAALMGVVPQDLLLVLKMNSLVRNMNKKLGAEVDRFRANARLAVRGLHHNNSSIAIVAPHCSSGMIAGNSTEAGDMACTYPWISVMRVWYSIRNCASLYADMIAVEINFSLFDFVRAIVRCWNGVSLTRDTIG
jgi:aarF domain-containing kinase